MTGITVARQTGRVRRAKPLVQGSAAAIETLLQLRNQMHSPAQPSPLRVSPWIHLKPETNFTFLLLSFS
jgi:hypothetical protein